MTVNFNEEVAIVTGAGGGLGRSHALSLAQRGARVVVNDIAPKGNGAGEDSPAELVAKEIIASGGSAIAHSCDVTDAPAVQTMVDRVIGEWGRIDVLINNAGILRDRTFAKMDVDEFRSVLDVHLMGSVHCTKAVWPHMMSQQYGRILMTTSASGIYGNFGQSNYGAAKSGVVGLMNVLAIEGERYGIRVNALAPTAATGMTEGLFDQASWDVMSPESITPGAVFLVSEGAPTKTILGAGGGVFAVAKMVEAAGVFLSHDERSPEAIAEQWEAISDISATVITGSAFDQTGRYLEMTTSTEAETSQPETTQAATRETAASEPSATQTTPSDQTVTAKVQS
ncbi:MAG: SDR family NAD(P)-dependent oxidoreductase [Brevibacterium sp.]